MRVPTMAQCCSARISTRWEVVMLESKETEKSFMPLLITSMAVIAPVLFVLGLVVGNQMQGGVVLTPDSLSSWLSAIATVAIATLTFILAKETWYLREAQVRQLAELKRENIRPNIGLELESSRVGVNFINFKISNFGKGIARRIVFEFLDRDGKLVPPNHDVVVEKFRKFAIFRQGLESMGIRQVISSYLFSFFELGGELKGEIFKPYLNIVVGFEDVEGNRYSNVFNIDFAQYEGMGDLGGEPLHEISSEIKKIREQIGKVVGNSGGRMDVDVFSAADRKREAEETQQWLEAQRSRVS